MLERQKYQKRQKQKQRYRLLGSSRTLHTGMLEAEYRSDPVSARPPSSPPTHSQLTLTSSSGASNWLSLKREERECAVKVLNFPFCLLLLHGPGWLPTNSFCSPGYPQTGSPYHPRWDTNCAPYLAPLYLHWPGQKKKYIYIFFSFKMFIMGTSHPAAAARRVARRWRRCLVDPEHLAWELF